MGKFIKKCCICSKVYGIETMNTFEGERISHGYCSKDCMEAKETQIMTWSDELNMFVLECALMVGGNLYYRGQLLETVVVYTKNTVGFGRLGPDGYDIYDINDFEDEAASLAAAKIAARNNNVNILI